MRGGCLITGLCPVSSSAVSYLESMLYQIFTSLALPASRPGVGSIGGDCGSLGLYKHTNISMSSSPSGNNTFTTTTTNILTVQFVIILC